MRNDNLIVPKTRKDIIRNWVFMSDEEQAEWENVNNYGYMMLEKMFDITPAEISKAIEYYFGYNY